MLDFAPNILPEAFRSATTTGERTVIAKKAFVQSSESRPVHRKARQRQRRKLQRLADLLQVVPGPRCFETSDVTKQAVYFRYSPATADCNYSDTSRLIPRSDTSFTCPFNSSNMTIVDTVDGAIFRNEKKEIVFILIPRQSSLDSLSTFASDDVAMMEAYQKLSTNLKRGSAKPVETRFKCCIAGFNADRGGPGIVLSKNCRDDEAAHIQQLKHLCCKCQRIMCNFLPTQDLRALSIVKSVVPFPTLAGSDTESIFPTASMSVDYCSAAHVDKDFFYSMLAVRSAQNDRTTSAIYDANTELKPPVAQHFVFPTVGIAVSLRPGDHLIFNPHIPHCCSEKLTEYDTHRVFLCAFYLKTAIIGMNDNSLPLTSLQENSVTTSKN